jgi:hypothetical protein
MKQNWKHHVAAAAVAVAVSTLGIYAFVHAQFSVDWTTYLAHQAQAYDRQTHASAPAKLLPLLGEGMLQAAFAIVPYALTLKALRRTT